MTLFKRFADILKSIHSQYFTILQLKKYIRPYLPSVILLIVLNILGTVVGMLNPLLTQKLIDKVLPARDWNLFYIIFAFYIAFFIISLLSGTGVSYLQTIIEEKMSFNIKKDMQKACSRASYSFFECRGAGEHVFRFNNDVSTVADIYTNQFPNIFVIVVQLAFFLAISFWYSPKFTLIYLSVIPLRIFFEILKSNKLQPLQKEQLEVGQELDNFYSQFRMGILTTKVFCREKFEEKRLVSILAKRIRLVFKNWRIDTFYELLKNFFGDGWEAVVMFIGWGLVIKGDLTIGVLVALQLYLGRLSSPISSSIRIIGVLMQGSVAAERIQQTLNAEPENYNKNKLLDPNIKLNGNIEFKDVSFGYLSDKMVVQNISFTVKPGMTVGITGPSGVGKTTLINLLLRIYEYKTGSIIIDGIDIKTISISNLRRQFSIVQQEIFLFNGTIRDNILYGNRKAAESDIIKAAKAAQAHEFIINTPDGYDTILGEKTGINLSSGQKQRIALARALIKDSPILILDEFTAALDAESEYNVLNSIKELFSDKVILIVSHRVLQLLDTDLVLVIHNGSIAQSGVPRELLHQEGILKKLYQLQHKITEMQFEREYQELEKDMTINS